jgi:hypothetical protein
MENKLLYQDDLRNLPVPEILASIEKWKVPGVLSIDGDPYSKKIFLEDGKIIFATSTDPDERLGEFLLNKGRITQAQYDESVVRLKRGEGRQGKILVDMGVLTPKGLFENVTEQITTTVLSLFNWEQGRVAFEIGDYKKDEMIKIAIPLRKAILDGVKAMWDAKRILGRLGTKTTVFAPVFDLKDVLALRLDDQEMKLLQMVDGRKSVYELVTKGPLTQPQNAKLLYVFMVLKLIEKKSDGVIKIQWKTTGDVYSS